MAWWRRDARTSCTVVVSVKRRRRRGRISKQAAPTRPRVAEPEGTAAPVEAARFEMGDLVIIDGLTSKPELNGRTAHVRGADPAKGRLLLELLHDGTQILVKFVNCRKAYVDEAKEVAGRLDHELSEAPVRPQARSHEVVEATGQTRQQLQVEAQTGDEEEIEEEIEEICTPSVAACADTVRPGASVLCVRATRTKY